MYFTSHHQITPPSELVLLLPIVLYAKKILRGVKTALLTRAYVSQAVAGRKHHTRGKQKKTHI